MTPTTPIPDTASASQPAADFVRTQRQTASYIFLALSIAFLVTSIALAMKAFRPAPPAEDAAVTQKDKDKEDPLDLTKAEKPKIANPYRSSYMVGWIGSLKIALLLGGVGIYLAALPQKPGLEPQKTEARVVLLVAGGILGLILILLGGAYFYLWSESLAKALKGEMSEIRWVVGPVLGIAAGAALVFAAIQPARADERNNSTIRRLVYGANFGVTTLLLFVALVIGNVFVSLKMPNKLDTTETGFYTLTETTQKFLPTLTEPINFYVIPDADDRQVSDVRQFAESAQELSGGKLRVEFVSQVSNKAKLLQLVNKYPRIGPGILLTTGDDEKRYVFVPWRELFDFAGNEAKGFAGEGRVMKELRYLADNEQKAIVYFTQGSGEPGLGEGGPKGDLTFGGSVGQLKAFLEKSYTEVRPLNLRTAKTVPADADVVVVVEPQNTMAEASVKAIRDYMNAPRADKKKGKLIVLAGAFSGSNGKVPKTGLEGLLAEFNVQLGDKFIYTNPLAISDGDYRFAILRYARASEDNLIVQTVGRSYPGMRWRLPRETTVIQQGNPAYRALPLLLTDPKVETWLEDEEIKDAQKTIGDLLSQNGDAIRQRKGFTDEPRIVAAVVSEAAGGGNPHGGAGPAGTPRMLVVGEGYAFTDEGTKGRSRGTFDIVSVGLDWLRDRPTLPTEAETKKYKEYQTPDPASVDSTRLFLLPLGFAILLVGGLGTGVWVMRRK